MVRTDLKMGKGKIAGQAAHAAVRACGLASFWRHPRLWWKKVKWFKEGETKIVLKVKDDIELASIIIKLHNRGIKYAIVTDAGRTQIEPGTLTAIGFGPVEDEVADKIVGDLKLL